MSEQLILHSNDAGDIIDIDLLPTQSCKQNEIQKQKQKQK